MIRHIVMFSLKPENKEENTAEFLRRGAELCGLPVIKSGRAVSRVQGAPNANFDVALIMDFESVDQLNTYQVSPEHVEFGEFVRGIRTDRACIDYEI